MTPSLNNLGGPAHALPDDQTLLLPAFVPRRKSASSLPTSAAAASTAAAALVTSGKDQPSGSDALPISVTLPLKPLYSCTVPSTPYNITPSTASPGSWGGTFFNADTDANADADTDNDDQGPNSASHRTLYKAPRSATRSTLALSELSTPPSSRSTQQKQQTTLPLSLLPPQLPPPSKESARDSLISILDDPLFQRFQSASADRLNTDGEWQPPPSPAPDHPLRASPACDYTDIITASKVSADAATDLLASGGDRSRHEAPHPSRPLPEQDASAVMDSDAGSRPIKLEQVNIAVIGAQNVGKSSFIQRALRLPQPPAAAVTAIRLDIENVPYAVAVIELDLEHFDLDPSKTLKWPRQIGGHMIPRIDGALMLYDVMNQDSIGVLPSTISSLHNLGLPTFLVATKCDNPESTRQLNADALATVFPSILNSYKTSLNAPYVSRDCLQAIIQAAVYNRRGADYFLTSKTMSSTRRRAASSAAHLDAPSETQNGRPLSSDQSSSKHSRASSDLSLLRADRSQNSKSPRVDFSNEESADQIAPGTLRFHSAGRLDIGQATFLDTEESDSESAAHQSDDNPIPQRNDEIIFERQKEIGSTFDELVNRLVATPVTRADNNLRQIFLCLYRKFAPPNRLLSAIIERFNQTWDDKNVHFLERTAAQFRMLEVITQWVSMYPGDFARPNSRKQLENLAKRLADEPVFAVASQQLSDHLKHDVVDDDDTGWEQSDEIVNINETSTLTTSTVTSSAKAASISSTPSSGPSQDAMASDSMRTLAHSDDPTTITETAGVKGPVQFQLYSFEDYEREANTMVPMATVPLNKARYHFFLSLDENDVAEEMTRIDWIMFNSFRIRDLVRHVSLPMREKERCQSLKNVNRMISHFNHIAKWVANMILIRDKAKHRALMLQKFMIIAQRLRELKNYNGLAAVLAGINGTAIHRLAQTRTLVDGDIQKRFLRLVLLMSTQKSHFAYRMAWENSTPPRIPFMPLHRGDIVSAEEGSLTFVGPNGDRINWHKFEVLGEVLLPIMRSQNTPYMSLRKHPAAHEIVLHSRMPTDDEDLYQRSVQVEPVNTPIEPRKKFPWLPK